MDPRTAMITGGAQGIGRCLGLSFLKNGYNVVIVDVDEEAGEETQHELSRHGNVTFVFADVAKAEHAVEAVRETIESFDRLDVLINNAGIMISRPIEKLTVEEWNRVIGTNLTGPFLFAKFSAPHLRDTRGCIINISSTRALMSEPDTEAYTASKGGIHALTHGLAISLGPEIRVNCISPGWIDVSEWKKESERELSDLSTDDHQQHPAGRVGIPQDIANLALFLADPANSFITGANFVVDGGMTRKMMYLE